MDTQQFAYKGNGLLWPGLPQLVMTGFLIFFWYKGIATGAPPVALGFLLLITTFIVLMFNFSFPRSFILDGSGLSMNTTLGFTVTVPWDQVQTIQKTGTNLVIKTAVTHWSGRIINKYMAFLPLLENGSEFERLLNGKTVSSEQ